MLCDDLEACEEGGGRETQEEGDIYVLMCTYVYICVHMCTYG